MHPLLIFADETAGNYQTTKLEIQKNATGLNDELSTEVQILLNITSNSKFFSLTENSARRNSEWIFPKNLFWENKQTKAEPI